MPAFSNDPFVATTRGYRRKIGPKSKYGTNDDAPAYGDGRGPQGAQSSMNGKGRLGSMPSRLGTPVEARESAFASEARNSNAEAGARQAHRQKVLDEHSANEARNKTDREAQDARIKADADKKAADAAGKPQPKPRGPWTPAFKPKPLPKLKK